MSDQRTHQVTKMVYVDVTINDPDVVARCVENHDGWREQMYANMLTEDDVLSHLAYNCIYNGIETVDRLDGWADLPPEAATMRITDVESW